MGAEEAGLDVVALESPGDKTDEAVVEASAERGGEGCVRSGGVGVHVAETEHCFREGTEPADRENDTRGPTR